MNHDPVVHFYDHDTNKEVFPEYHWDERGILIVAKSPKPFNGHISIEPTAAKYDVHSLVLTTLTGLILIVFSPSTTVKVMALGLVILGVVLFILRPKQHKLPPRRED